MSDLRGVAIDCFLTTFKSRADQGHQPTSKRSHVSHIDHNAEWHNNCMDVDTTCENGNSGNINVPQVGLRLCGHIDTLT